MHGPGGSEQRQNSVEIRRLECLQVARHELIGRHRKILPRDRLDARRPIRISRSLAARSGPLLGHCPFADPLRACREEPRGASGRIGGCPRNRGQGSQGYCVRLVCVPANEGVLTSATSTTTASTGEQRELRVCAGMRRSKGRVQIPPSPPQSPGQRLFFFASAMKCAIPATIATCSTLSSLAVMREVSERSARCALVLCAVSVT